MGELISKQKLYKGEIEWSELFVQKMRT